MDSWFLFKIQKFKNQKIRLIICICICILFFKFNFKHKTNIYCQCKYTLTHYKKLKYLCVYFHKIYILTCIHILTKQFFIVFWKKLSFMVLSNYKLFGSNIYFVNEEYLDTMGLLYLWRISWYDGCVRIL